jgi:CRP-like cAMP-binding protein
VGATTSLVRPAERDVASGNRPTSTNHVFRTLSDEARRRLQPYLEYVRLPAGQLLYESGDAIRHALFIEHGVVSLLGSTSDGDAVEVAMIGRESVVGLPTTLRVNTLPYQVLVSFSGDGHRVRIDILRLEFTRDVSVQNAVLDDVHHLVAQMSQAVVCNRFHTASQRFCRWLLMLSDRVGTTTISVTQEGLGHVLGTDRKRISIVATQLQDDGCIRQRHGQIRILDRRRLEQQACECYRSSPMRQQKIHVHGQATPPDRLNER